MRYSSDSTLETGQLGKLRLGKRDRLEQRAHAGRTVGGQAGERDLDLDRLGRRSQRLQVGGALLDSEPQQKFALLDRSMAACPDTFGLIGQHLKIDVSGEVDRARRRER